LLEIRDILHKKGSTEKEIEETPIVEVTDIFTGCEFKYFKKGIESGEIILAKKFPKFKSLFGYNIQPDRRFGTEIASKVKTITGLQGLIHSDEDLFGKYKFSKEQIDELVKKLGIESEDAFIMIIGPKSTVRTAMDIITQRCEYALINVPKETRRAKEDGNTDFLRDLHGGSRLYPDTDSREILVTQPMINTIKDSLKSYQYPWDLIVEWAKRYKTSEETIKGFVMGDDFLLIKSLLSEFEDIASTVITTINETFVALRRSNVPVERLQYDHYRMLFKAVKTGTISKDAISIIMKTLAEYPESSIEEAKKKAGIKDIADSEIEKIVQQGVEKNIELIQQRGMAAMGAVMGYVKLQLGEGGFDGKKVSDLIKSKIGSIAGSLSPQKQEKKENTPPVEKKSEKKMSEPKKAESNEKKSTESKKDTPNENKTQEQKQKSKKTTNKNGGNQ
jgi:glutamyl-tRNA(Gln) amidotransferase subunit E